MNYHPNQNVPFEITHISHGLQELKGLISLSKEGFELEFEVKDSLIGFFKSGITNLRIPFSDLESISFKKGWFTGKIILEGTSMRAFEDLPGSEQATCVLKIKRNHKKEAEKLVSKPACNFLSIG